MRDPPSEKIRASARRIFSGRFAGQLVGGCHEAVDAPFPQFGFVQLADAMRYPTNDLGLDPAAP